MLFTSLFGRKAGGNIEPKQGKEEKNMQRIYAFFLGEKCKTIGVSKHKLVRYEPCHAAGAFWEVEIVNSNCRFCTAMCHSLCNWRATTIDSRLVCFLIPFLPCWLTWMLFWLSLFYLFFLTWRRVDHHVRPSVVVAVVVA